MVSFTIESYIEHILSNLKVLSQLKEGDKLNIKHGNLSIDKPWKGQPVYRWFLRDSRETTIDAIQKLIFHAIDLNENSNMNAKWPCVKEEFPKVIKGLESLKITYEMDATIVANIEIVIDKLNIILQN